MQDVLTLNRSWVAVHVVGWQRAMSLLYQGHAAAIDVDDFKTYNFTEWTELSKIKNGDYIYTEKLKILVPEVIALTVFDGLPPNEVKLTRRNIFERDRYHCGFCGKRFKREDLNLDHVIPRRLGGKTTWENVICCCKSCNIKKGGRTPEEAGMKLQVVPTKPGWKGNMEIILGVQRRISWQRFIDQAYWSAELEE